jgi:hypothetical protein
VQRFVVSTTLINKLSVLLLLRICLISMKSKKFLVLALAFCAILPSAFSQGFKISPNGTYIGCEGDTVELEAPKGYVSYLWSTSETTRIIHVHKAGKYYGGAVDVRGSYYVDSVEIKFLKPIRPDFYFSGKSSTICLGDSLIIEAGGKGFKYYQWSNNVWGQRNATKPTKSGALYLTVQDSNGCWGTHKVEYTVKNCSGGSACDGIIEAWPNAHLCGDKDSVILEVKNGYKSYVWSDSASGRVRIIKHSGKYIVTVTDTSGHTCSDTIEISKTNTTLSIWMSAKDGMICKGDSVVVEVSKEYKKYYWSTGDSGTHRLVLHPTKTTNYVVYALDKYGCTLRKEFKITVNDSCDGCKVIISAWPDKVLCGDHDSTILEAVSGHLSYYWEDGSTKRVRVIKKSGWYSIAVLTKDSTVCYDSIYIGKGSYKKLELWSNAKHHTICPGDKITIEGTYGFKYYYFGKYGKKEDNDFTFEPKETQTFVVEAVTADGCESRAEIKITVKDTCDKCPKLIEAWPSTTLCGHDSINLEAKYGYKLYQWSGGHKGRSLWVKKTGWYYLDVKDSNNNVCRDSIYISEKSAKGIEIKISPKGPYCIGDTVEISATSGFVSYGWNTKNKTKGFEFIIKEKKSSFVVEALDSHGCEGRAVRYLEADSCKSSGLTEVAKLGMLVYPNPAHNGSIIVESNHLVDQYIITNLLGEEIISHKGNEGNALDVSHLFPGTYILTVQAKDAVAHKRIIISK